MASVSSTRHAAESLDRPTNHDAIWCCCLDPIGNREHLVGGRLGESQIGSRRRGLIGHLAGRRDEACEHAAGEPAPARARKIKLSVCLAFKKPRHRVAAFAIQPEQRVVVAVEEFDDTIHE